MDEAPTLPNLPPTGASDRDSVVGVERKMRRGVAAFDCECARPVFPIGKTWVLVAVIVEAKALVILEFDRGRGSTLCRNNPLLDGWERTVSASNNGSVTSSVAVRHCWD